MSTVVNTQAEFVEIELQFFFVAWLKIICNNRYRNQHENKLNKNKKP